MTSTCSSLAIPVIEAGYGSEIAAKVRQALVIYYLKEVIMGGTSNTKVLIEVRDGLQLLGQLLGSAAFEKSFSEKQLEENKVDILDLLEVVSDHHTALHLFVQYTISKLPLLLHSEMIYSLPDTNYKSWDDWVVPLSIGISVVVNSSLSQLSQRQSTQ